jgi:hypothetical protein
MYIFIFNTAVSADAGNEPRGDFFSPSVAGILDKSYTVVS